MILRFLHRMNPAAKSLIYNTAAAIIPPAILARLQTGRLTILTYHGLTVGPIPIPDPCMLPVDEFRAQMVYLKKHFDVVKLTDAIGLLRDEMLDRPTVVITFDDGYQSNHDLALPILEELSLPATIFLSTGYLNTESTIWTGLLQHAFAVTRQVRLDWHGRTWDIAKIEDRIDCMISIKAELKLLPNRDLMQIIDELMFKLTGCAHVSLPDDSPYRMLNLFSINNLSKSAMIELGAHTHSHRILSKLDSETQREEICMSKEVVESMSSRPCLSFAYPNGCPEDYDAVTLSILKDCGFEVAVTTVPELCSPTSPDLELPRINVDGRSSLAQFKFLPFNLPGRFIKQL